VHQRRHEGQFLGGPHRVGAAEALDTVDDECQLGDESLSSTHHVGEDAGYLAPLPGRPSTRLLLQDTKGHKVLWMDLGVCLQELGELGIGVCPGELLTRGPWRDNVVIKEAACLAAGGTSENGWHVGSSLC